MDVDDLIIPTPACAESINTFALATALLSPNKPPIASCIASTLPFIAASLAAASASAIVLLVAASALLSASI